MVNPLDHPICLAAPRRLTATESWHEHIPFAMFLVDLLRPSVLVELGTRAGDSYCTFCQAVQELRLATRCYAVGTWPDQARSPLEAGLLNDLRAHHDPAYGSFSSLIQGPFDDAARLFADGTIGLLHIDGEPTYEALEHDFEVWLPKMSGDGVILLHDTNVGERGVDVRRFWGEIKSRYPSFEFLHDHGLGVLAVGESCPRDLLALLTAGPDDATKIQSFFFQLGHRVSLRREIDALRLAMASQEEGFGAERERWTRDTSHDERAVLALKSEVTQAERRLRDRDRELQERNLLLQRITRSRGWWWLNRYRDVKHGVRGSLVRWMRAAAALAVLRPLYHPTVEPANDLRPAGADGAWEATGRDPQFNLYGRWPRGWTEVRLAIEPETPVFGQGRLYVDRGAGYTEADSFDLGAVGGLRQNLVRLGPDVVGLRLDPFESPGRFRINTLVLRPVPALWKWKGASAAVGGLDAPASRPTPRPRRVSTSHGFPLAPPVDPYDAWIEVNQWNARRAAVLRECLAAAPELPLVSVVMPVYNAPPEFLDRAIATVVDQRYEHWELCIADDASTDPTTPEILRRWAARDRRIRVVFREANGNISRATNTAAEMAQGEYIALMDQDDELTPDALGEVAVHLAQHPETDVLYSDDDKISVQGRRFAAQFKPDWSPELLLSYMYIGHLFVLRRRLFLEAGGLRAGYEGAQDYDLALRVTERARRVGHIAKVLYHWRVMPGSTAVSGAAKPESFRAAERALQEALDRRGIPAQVRQPAWAVAAGCGIFAHEFPDDGPRVAIVIPTRNNVDVLQACLASLAKTTYRNYEVVIVDNESDDAATLGFLGRTRHRVLRIANPGPRFSFAAINNRAVEGVDGPYVLFLNDDTEILTPAWLSQLVGYLGIPGVGAVGARLRFPDGRIQHAGIVHGYYNGMVGPAFKLSPAEDHGYASQAVVTRNYGAVTAACLLTRRDLFLTLGGFDEKRFAIAYNDVDYCYRLREAGHRVVFCPDAELIHHESLSRGAVDDPAETAAYRRIYAGLRDPYYNPNLSLAHERFAIDARTLAPARLRPIRALMCAHNLKREGAPNSQLELTLRLTEAGVIEPIVYCPQDGPLRTAYEASGIRVEVSPHPLSAVHDLRAYDHAVDRFAERIADWNVEVVYGNTRQTFYAIDAAWRLGLGSIWNQRESEPWQTYFDYLGPDIASRALECFGFPYRVIFVADATRETCATLNTRHNFITIHNALDRARFETALQRWPRPAARNQLNVGSGETVILLLGTVCQRKGQLDLVEAVARLPESTTRTLRCFIVGDAGNSENEDRGVSYDDMVNDAIVALPAARAARIERVAETDEPALYYAAADIFVCTSRIESFPRVILEAMAAGLPIVTTPVFGIAEQVREGVNALCYAPGDTGALAGHLENLLRDPAARRRLGEHGRHVLDSLSDLDEMTTAYASAFREAWLSAGPPERGDVSS